MKINSKTQFGIRFMEDSLFHDSVTAGLGSFNFNSSITMNDFEKSIHVQMLQRILHKSGFQEFLITRTVQEMAEKVKLPKDLTVFSSMKRTNKTFLIDDRQFYRFMFEGDFLRCIHLIHNPESGMLNYRMFGLNLKTGVLTTNQDEKIEESSMLFLKLLTFVEFADLEVKILIPNQKLGTKKQGTIKNEFHRIVTIVDSNWNKYVIRMEGFPVSGHFRFQPYGEGNSLRKYIWIDGYEKTGYFRNPKKDNS